MLDRIRRLIDRPDRALQTLPRAERLHLAAACLLVEAARSDDAIAPEERMLIHRLVAERFELPAGDAAELVKAAEDMADGPAPWHSFTSRLKDAFDADERIALIEMLWDVVYADGHLHHLESSLLRRVGGLLYVSDRDRGEARKRVLARRGLPQGPALPD